MHPNPAKNLRDYLLFCFVVSLIFACGILATGSLLNAIWTEQALILCPLPGLAAAACVYVRDVQHRSVPWTQASSPRQFIEESHAMLQANSTQLTHAENVVLQLNESAARLAQSFERAGREMRGESTAQENSLSGIRGFE